MRMNGETRGFGALLSPETKGGNLRIGFWIIAVLVVGIDQWTKYLAETWLAPRGTVSVLPGFLSFTHVYNTGMAFGQLRGAGPLLALAGLAAVAGILMYRFRLLQAGEPVHPLLILGLALPFGGAVGNMLDRLRLGKVIDFIDINDWFQWPVFNIADSAITVGAVCLMVYFLFLQPAEDPAAAETAQRAPGPGEDPGEDLTLEGGEQVRR